MKTILITGCSSGFGLEIAGYFLARDWQVIATMRTPRSEVLPSSDRLRVLALDVTNPDSIKRAVEAAGPIDALVNNAGFGAASPAEATPMETVRRLFETNTFGTIAMTQELVPQFRERRAGVIVNVTSSVTLKILPLVAAYRASKAAVNAFTESMAVELEPFGVQLLQLALEAGREVGVRGELAIDGPESRVRFIERDEECVDPRVDGWGARAHGESPSS